MSPLPSRPAPARLVLAVLIGAMLAGLGGTSTASAATPWWHLASSATPANLGAPKTEVQEITASPTGLFALEVEGGLIGIFGSPPNPPTWVEPTAANVEEALEAAYGKGNVEVTGGPAGVAPLIVRSVNEDAGEFVAPIETFGAGSHATVLTEGGSGKIVIRAVNVGDGSIDGTATPVTIADGLPAGLTPHAMSGAIQGPVPGGGSSQGSVSCSVHELKCTFGGTMLPFDTLEITISVSVSAVVAAGAQNDATISGGGAPSAAVAQPVTVSDEKVRFGVERYELTPEAEGGTPDTQAGSHPFQVTTTLDFNQTAESPFQPAEPRNLNVELPPGLVGNPSAVPQCTLTQFVTINNNEEDLCPPETAVGVASVTFINLPLIGGPPSTAPLPVFNLAPARGEPARFGFEVDGTPAIIDITTRSGSDYGVTVRAHNIPETVALLSSQVTLWGVPGDPAHDNARGWTCLDAKPGCAAPQASQPTPFVRLPTSCAGALGSSLTAESWSEPGFLPPTRSAFEETIDGCNRVPFGPELRIASSAQTASGPTELDVRLNVPQQAGEAPEGVAESDVENTTVTLPAGLQVNPAVAGSLQACTEADIGFERYDQQTGQTFFHEESEQERQGEVPHQECPAASKLGKVTVKTPLLSEPLTGWVYQAAQGAGNPFGSLLALYVVAEAPKLGVRVRLAGKVAANPVTGQLVSTFTQTPQLPFEEFDLKFFGGSRAPLATTGCGSYETTTSIEPWSGNPAAHPSSSFAVATGPNGTPCPGTSFAPSFTAGTTNNQAGAFSPFTLALSRQDNEQGFSAIATQMPPGLAGMLSRVALCGEAQANAGGCPAASQIGHVTVSAGVGAEPIVIPEVGKPQDPVYLTGPYQGAPFGLSIVVPAEAGPFNLDEDGRPVVVRARIEVDPHTAQVSVLSDPMPTRLQGIPLDVKTIDVTIDRSEFMFNPTNCTPLSVSGTIVSDQGAAAGVSNRFQAANCASLPFKPTFTVSTQAKTSKAGGAGLHVRVTSAFGQANIGKTRVILPEQLPSRLTTLQKACRDTVFDANPASCPAASVVGTAIAHTPVLNNPLTGPAYLVSHGGAAFPDLVIVLQGEGVVLYLDGNTNIKKGITSSTFNSVPDAPVSAFELTLPEGPHSVLATNLPAKAKGSMCGQKLSMPTTMTAQNGAVLTQATKIAVSGCPRHGAKQAKAASRRHRRGGATKK